MSTLKFNSWQKTDGTQISPVLQMVTAGPDLLTTFSTTVDASNQNWSSWPYAISATLTPKSNNSIIYAHATTQVRSWGTAGTGIQLAICYQRSGGSLDILLPSSGRSSTIESNILQYTGSGLSNMWNSLSAVGYMNNNSTTAMTITLRYAAENTSGSPALGDPRYGGTFMTVWEIAA